MESNSIHKFVYFPVSSICPVVRFITSSLSTFSSPSFPLSPTAAALSPSPLCKRYKVRYVQQQHRRRNETVSIQHVTAQHSTRYTRIFQDSGVFCRFRQLSGSSFDGAPRDSAKSKLTKGINFHASRQRLRSKSATPVGATAALSKPE